MGIACALNRTISLSLWSQKWNSLVRPDEECCHGNVISWTILYLSCIFLNRSGIIVKRFSWMVFNQPSPCGDRWFIKWTQFFLDGQLAEHTNKVL